MAESIKMVMGYKELFLKGLGYTMMVSVEAIIVAVCIGTILTVLRMGGDSLFNRIIQKIVAVYISFVRGTPILVQIYIIFQALSMLGLNLSAYTSGVIALSLNSGGFMAEILRGGFSAIPKGQIEAAEAIGMPKAKIWTRIILPQVFRIVIPQLTSEFINVIKVPPMLSVLSVVELTRTAERLVKVTGEAIPFYVTIAIIYFIVCTILEEFVKLQQHRIRKA